MNLGEMETKVRIYADDRSGDRWTGTLNSELVGHVNVAQGNIQEVINDADENLFMACKRYDVDNTEDAWEFTLPTDFLRLILAEREVTNADPIPVTWVDFRKRHEELGSADFPFPTSISRPRCYMRGTKLGVIDPNADYTLRVWYIKRIPDLAGATDASEIPLEWHDLICLEAAAIALGTINRVLPTELEMRRAQKMQSLIISIQRREQQRPRYANYVPD